MPPPMIRDALHPLPDGRLLRLLPERAAFLPDTPGQPAGLLLLADAHIGKAASFRRLGVPVPQGTTGANLARLDALLARLAGDGARLGPLRRLVLLGDFLHAASGRTPAVLDALAAWRARHATLSITLVRGNHDDHAGDPPAALGIEVVDEPWCHAGLALCHDPALAETQALPAYALAGHRHPVRRLGRGFDTLRLPCFHAGARVLVLPAFGEFTGGAPLEPAPGDRVYGVTEAQVFAWPEPAARTPGAGLPLA